MRGIGWRGGRDIQGQGFPVLLVGRGGNRCDGPVCCQERCSCQPPCAIASGSTEKARGLSHPRNAAPSTERACYPRTSACKDWNKGGELECRCSLAVLPPLLCSSGNWEGSIEDFRPPEEGVKQPGLSKVKSSVKKLLGSFTKSHSKYQHGYARHSCTVIIGV